MLDYWEEGFVDRFAAFVWKESLGDLHVWVEIIAPFVEPLAALA
jgi:hypothetical protein